MLRRNPKNGLEDISPIWFSQKQNRYDTEIKKDQKVFHWTNRSELLMYIANIEKNGKVEVYAWIRYNQYPATKKRRISSATKR